MQFKGILAESLRRRPSGVRLSRAAILSRFTVRNLVLLTSLITCMGFAHFLFSYASIRRVDVSINRPHRPHQDAPSHVLGKPPPWARPPPLPCIGPRGKLISESPDDQIKPTELEIPYPTPFAGSYSALELPEEWMTIEGRYGPYGYDDGRWFARRSQVDWDKVDWGQLQMQCQDVNKERFPPGGRTPFNANEVRFRMREDEDDTDADTWFYTLRERLGFPKPHEYLLEETGKTALVLRTFDGYKYTEEDVINIRSLVSEASLQSGGEFTVVLFVNVKGKDRKIFESQEAYDKAIDDANIPVEFRNLVVLWDENLLRSWYPKVGEYSIMFQINQAFQLFALFYPEFEHHWQLEMDTRSLGHTKTLLQALDRFSRGEPRKQAWERASYTFMSSTMGEYYPDFVAAVNASLGGGATVWGPMRIPEIPNPIGPEPPVKNPEDDPFRWGVHEPADLVVTSPCSWSMRTRAWAFKGWWRGPFSKGRETPRIMCPPAIQRSSRQLLLAVHTAQTRLGLAVPSEATLPSFALWHGLKLSYPPAPLFRHEPIDPRHAEIYFNGGRPGESVKLADAPEDGDPLDAEALEQEVSQYVSGGKEGADFEDGPIIAIPFVDAEPRDYYKGFACGEAFYNQRPRVSLTYGLTWWWRSSFPRRLLAAWSGGRWKQKDAEKPGSLQEEGGGVLVENGGHIWAPAGWMHPVKT